MNPITRWLERRRIDRELAAEMAEHIQEKAEDLMERGHSPEEAVRIARRQFGNPLLHHEKSREAWGWSGVEEFARDIRFGCRLLAKSPGFAITAFLTLAIGIGASTAVFTLVDAVLLKPLGYRNSGQLVVAWERIRMLSPDPTGPNPRHADLWRRRATAFSAMNYLQQGKRGVTSGSGHPVLFGSVTAEPNVFELLEVTPLLGRGFEPKDGIAGRDHVAVITWKLWRDLFHGDPAILGKTIRVADTPCQIIGVLPEDFRFPNANALRSFRSGQSLSKAPEPAIFLPHSVNPNEFDWGGDFGNGIVLARLRPGVTVIQANAQIKSIQTEVNRHFRAAGAGVDVEGFVQLMQEAIVARSRTTLWFLMAAVTGLLLIACLNLANAQLGRAVSRQKEAAVRSALGASRWRLVRVSLAENMILALLGGSAGVLLAAGALYLLQRCAPVDLPRLAETHLNVTVLLFSLAATFGSCLLFGLLPALRLGAADPQFALQSSSARATGNLQGSRVRAILIGLEVFGCVALLLFTGLFSKSLLNLLQEDKGFDSAHITVAEVDLPHGKFAQGQSRTNFDDAVLHSLRGIPGVESAAMVSAMPLEGESWIEQLTRVDRPRQQTPLLNLRWVSPGYFEALREKMVRGRVFEERDRNLSSMVVSEGFANSVWPDRDPVGAEVRVEGRKFTVIGVVADTRSASLKTAPVNMAYTHYKDRPPFADFFVVRGRDSAAALVPAVRDAIWRYAPDVTIARVKTLDSQLSDSLALERFQTQLVAGFGAAALALAMLGIYGVLSYAVAGRTQEIGVRMALGATRKAIYSLTFRAAAIPVFAGLICGFFVAAPGARLIRDLLYGVAPLDTAVLFSVAAVFLAAAATAALVPARRAASLDPMRALRTE
jgi:predicted permease